MRIVAISLCSILCMLLAWTPVFAQDSNQSPSCESPVGTWQNEMGSVLVIESLDEESGMISGAYKSASGAGATSFPLIGWANDAPADADKKLDHAQVYGFTVRWGEIGSITSWTGTCALVNDKPTLKTVWNLARPNTSYSWDHMVTGSATFTPAASTD